MGRPAGWQAAITAALFLSFASPCLATAGTASCPVDDLFGSLRVRPIGAELTFALTSGMRRSPTLAALARRIDSLAGLVYLEGRPPYMLRRALLLRGGLSHQVTVGPWYRLLRVTVETGRGDRTIATIAHELQHAVEVLETPDAIDVDSVGRLYQRIGVQVRAGIYETTAAQATGDRVLAELSKCRL